MTIIGIDPSMRSTGLCIIQSKSNKATIKKYKLICSVPGTTKKLRDFIHKDFELYLYEPESNSKELSSNQKELAKTKNIRKVLLEIKKILKKYKPDIVRIEGIAMGATGRIDELSGLNYAIRLAVLENPSTVLEVISPTSLKMNFTGNGHATKEMMILGWQANESNNDFIKKSQIPLGKHLEDLADAYALASSI